MPKTYNLTADQKTWLEAARDAFNSGVQMVPWRAARALRGTIADGFDPATIDPDLYADGNITLRGLLQLDPKSDWPAKIDKVLGYIKGLVVDHEDTSMVPIPFIRQATGLSTEDVCGALALARSLNPFVWSSAGGNGIEGKYPPPYMYVMIADDHVHGASLDFYEGFDGITKMLG